MAGQPMDILTGGSGYTSAPTVAPTANGVMVGAGTGAHVGVIGLVLIAAALLLLLDKAGFRFAVTAGKR